MIRGLTLARCVATLAAVALAGCGSSTTVVTDSAGGTSAAAPSSSSTSGSVSTTASAATASTSAAATGATRPLCTAARLSLSLLGQQGATGHGEVGFSLRNSGAGSCHTFGFPGVLFLSAAGGPLPTDARRVTRDFFGAAPAVGLVLPPGGEASFRLGVTHGQASSAGCVNATAVQIIPPDDTHTLRVTVPNGIYECGTVTVSPVRPGTTAFG